MKIIDYIEDKIPTWALSYLVKGDASGLEDGEAEEIDAWLAYCQGRLKRAYPRAVITLEISDAEPSFTRSPAFGLACDCVPGAVAAWLPKQNRTFKKYPLPWDE